MGHRDPSRGGAALEFALVLPVFLVLVMGALDYGYFFFARQVVAGAAREGARAGTMDSGNTTTARDAAYAYMTGNGINCDTMDFNCVHTSTVGWDVDIDGVTVHVNKLIVNIHFPFTSLTGYTAIPIFAQIKGYAEMRW